MRGADTSGEFQSPLGLRAPVEDQANRARGWDGSEIQDQRNSSVLGDDLPFKDFEGIHPFPCEAACDPARAPLGQLEVGSEVLGFQLIEVLGRGAFGKVYLARQGNLADRPVVLKISPHLDAEGKVLAQLQHTNIVPIYSIHRIDSLQVVCMPYFGTTTLKHIYENVMSQESLPETGLGLISTLIDGKSERESRRARPNKTQVSEEPRPSSNTGVAGESHQAQPQSSAQILKYLEGLSYVEAVLWVGSRLASGLAHAHERGILHLDLKPANILLTDEGQPMLLDFNLSLDLKIQPSLAGVGGTVLYMSPEQLQTFRGNPVTLDGRSDIYSLGIILFELLTGRRPLATRETRSDGLTKSLRDSRKRPAPPLRCWNKAVSPAVESIVRHCLESDPADRYKGAHELQEDIERHLASFPLKYANEPSLVERMTKWLRRHPTMTSTTTVMALAVLLLLLVCSGCWLALRDARRARARLNYIAFHQEFEKCQLLLNTVHDASGDHLLQGIGLARSAMSTYLNDESADLDRTPNFHDLPRDERRVLRSELAELIMLEVRAQVALAARTDSEEGRRQVHHQGIERLELARRIDSQSQAAFYQDRGRLLAALGRQQEAERDRSEAARVPLRTARDHYLLGTSLLAQGRPDRAELSLSRAVALDPRQFWSWFALGICHSDQGRHADAAADFSACTILVPQFAWPYLNRGLTLSRCGRLMEALASYDRALELDRGFVEAWVDRGLTYLALGRPEQARRDFERAIALHSRLPVVMVAHAETLSRLERHEEAEKAFAEAIRASPRDPIPLVARGFSRLNRDRTGAACDFSRALEIDPKNPRGYLGQAYLVRNQDLGVALSLVDKALVIDPDFGDALQLRALIRARLNDPGAESDVERIIRVPTPQRLYNAACALSLLTRTRSDGSLCSRALDYLERALETGLAADYLARDPDLDPLRDSPRFTRLLESRSNATNQEDVRTR